MPSIPFTELPNMENIVCNYLRNHSAIQALGARIVQKPPPKKDTPWIEVRELDGLDDDNVRVEFLTNHMLSFNCYAGSGRDEDGEGGGPPEAIAVSSACRAVLKSLENTVQDGAYISLVKVFGGPRFADEAMDRKYLTATIYTHPNGS